MKKYPVPALLCLIFLFKVAACQPAKTYSNKIGMDDVVLPPWIPLVVNESRNGGGHQLKIQCLGRTYIFDEQSLLPNHIISQNVDLIPSPILLNILSASGSIQWINNTMELADKSPTKADLIVSADATNCPGLKITCLYHIEYDGLIEVEIKLSNPKHQAVKIGNLDIPVKAGNALYEHRPLSRKAIAANPRKPSWISGALSSSNGVIDNSDFIPYVWLGNNDIGLFWFCETPVSWPIWTADNAMQLVRPDDGSKVVLRLNLNDNNHLTNSDWDFKFGLQATPVKTYFPGWRKWRISPEPNPNILINWARTDSTSTKYFGYPEASNPQAYRRMLDANHGKGIRVIQYACLTNFSVAAPEWENHWDLGYRSQATGDTKAFNAAPFVRTNLLSDSYRNFIIGKTQKFYDDYNVDGFYLDGSSLININFHNKLNYDSDDVAYNLPYFPILAQRNLYRREYSFVKQKNPNAIIIAHTSGSIDVPVLAYCDAYLDGEQFRIPFMHVQESYSDILPLDEFRTEFLGKQFGIVPIFLPEFDAARQKAIAPTQNLIGLILLHDALCWPISSNLMEWKKAYGILDNYDLSDAQFIPYYAKTPPASYAPAGIYVSLYKLSSGKRLIIIANLSDSNATGNVTLNGDYIGTKSFDIKSLPDKGVIEDGSNIFSVALKPSEYRIYIVEPK